MNNQTSVHQTRPDNVIYRAQNIVKRYPGTIALKGVDFNIYPGKVNVLVGENGAGKSTLMKIMAGIEFLSEGELFWKGKEIKLSTTKQAEDLGIRIIHQELNLCPNLTVADNIFLNCELTDKLGNINVKEQEREAAMLLGRLEQDINPRELVANLKVGQQQIVEIAKSLRNEMEILIMDEPTSALSNSEVKVLFRIINDLKSQGVAVIYISHKLEELIEIGDNITVLRDGELVTVKPMEEVTLQWIVRSMAGKDWGDVFPKRAVPESEEVVLSVKNLSCKFATGQEDLRDISFDLKKGEILGIYGLLGAGRSEVLEAIMGLNRDYAGEIMLNGSILKQQDIEERIREGVVLVPEDRQREGLIPILSVGHNMTLAGLWRLLKGGFHILKTNEKKSIKRMFDKMSVKAPSAAVPVSSLSGGNQQKVVIGKCLLTEPKVLLMDEPTRGIDVGAKGEVFMLMDELAKEGLGVLFVSSEIKEIIGVCDRVIVLSKGKKTKELTKEEITEERLVDASAIGHRTTKVG